MSRKRRLLYIYLKYKLSIVGILSIVIALGTWLIFCFSAPRSEALRSLVRVDACYHYELIDNQERSLLEWGYDTIASTGCWVDKYAVIPSCEGKFVGLINNTPMKSRFKNVDPYHVIKVGSDSIDSIRGLLKEQISDLNYYVDSHNVIDEGFDMIKEYTLEREKYMQKLTNLSKTLNGIDSTAKLKITCRINYIVKYKDGSGIWQTSKADLIDTVDEENGLLLFQIKGAKKPEFVKSQPMSLARKMIALMSTTNRKLIDFQIRPDSAGYYKGETNRDFIPHGHGKHINKDGSYYEGHWEHGQRNGFGFAVDNKRGLRAGLWVNDTYKGEKLTYNSDRIYGIDISKHQHIIKKKKYGIDWDKLKITGLGTHSHKNVNGQVSYHISFMYIKSTEGKTIVNPYYDKDYSSARSHGYRVGTYHFFSLTSKASDQANWFIKKSHFRKGDFPPVLDVEPLPSQIKKIGGDAELFSRVRLWLKLVERATGVKPILYVNQLFVNHHLKNAPDLKRDYQIWIARYGEYKPDIHLAIWQLCQDGKVNGIHGDVDINVFNGYKESYNNFISKHCFK